MRGVAVQIDGYDPVEGKAVTLRAASHDLPDICSLDGKTWWPAIATLPKLRYDLFDGSFAGQIAAPAASMALSIEPWPLFARYGLADAQVSLWTGEIGQPWSAWTLRLQGRSTARPQIKDARAELSLAVDDRWLDTALLAAYAGTTKAEGPAALKGLPKPLALGAPRYAPGTLIDSINSVFQVSGYGPVRQIEAALEKAIRYGAPIADYPSYDALVAATIPRGAWATALAVGMARFGAPPEGKVSFLLQGDQAGPDGWARLPGQIIRRLALLAGGAGRIDDASLNALDAARPYPQSIYLDEQTTARELIQRIAASVNAVAGVSWTGKLFVLPVEFRAPTLTLAADGSALPPVGRIDQLEIDAPWKRLAIQSERTWAVHDLSDVAFTATLIPMGDYTATTTYREGNVVQDQGSTWIYINPTPSAGNKPPALSTEKDAFWNVLAKAGATASDTYNAILSNESHIVPADAAGNVLSYDGAATRVQILQGSRDVTSSFQLDHTDNPQNLSGLGAYPRFTVEGGFDANEETASVTYYFTGISGSPHAGVELARTFSLAKSKGGRNGEPPAIITLSASALTARYDTTGALVPGQAITFGAVRQNTSARTLFTLRNSAGAAVHGPYEPGEFARLGGTTFWSAYDPDTITLTEAGIVAVIRDHGGATGRVTMIASIEGTGLADAVSINKVQDGAKGADGTSPYNAILSNESHTLPADAAGNVLSYAGASFTVTVFYGSQDVTSSFALDAVDNPQGLTGPPGYPTYSIDGGFDAAEASASVTYHFIGRGGTSHAGVRLSKTFSLAKSLGGAGGAPAPLITLTASAFTLRAGTDGNFIGGQRIDFASARQNVSDTPVWQVINADGTAVYSAPAATYAANFPAHWGSNGPDSLYLTPQGAVDNMNAYGLGPSRFSIKVIAGGVSDIVSIQKIQDGAKGNDGKNAVNVIADNETFTVPTDAAGNYAAFPVDVSRGHLRVYDGVTEVTGQCTFSIQNPLNLDGRIDATGAYYAVGLYGDTGYSDLVAIYNGATYSARLTASKVKDGAKGTDGINPPLVSVSASPQAIRYDKDNNLSSGPVTFTAVLVNAIRPVAWSSAIGHGIYGTPGVTFSGNSMTLSPERMRDVLAYNEANFGVATETIIATASGVSDRVTVTKIRDGATGAASTVPGPAGKDGYSLSVSQTAFVIPSFANGTSKPEWRGGAVRVALVKGGQEVAADSYAIASQSNMTSISVSGQAITFADIIGIRGEFTARAVKDGVAFDQKISVTRPLDGSAAFTNGATFSGATDNASVTASSAVPAGRTVTIAASANYETRRDNEGRGVLAIYWRNASTGGPLNYLGEEQGSVATNYNENTPQEPIYRNNPGSVAVSRQFTSPSPDAQIEYRAVFSTNFGTTVAISGAISIAVSG